MCDAASTNPSWGKSPKGSLNRRWFASRCLPGSVADDQSTAESDEGTIRRQLHGCGRDKLHRPRDWYYQGHHGAPLPARWPAHISASPFCSSALPSASAGMQRSGSCERALTLLPTPTTDGMCFLDPLTVVSKQISPPSCIAGALGGATAMRRFSLPVAGHTDATIFVACRRSHRSCPTCGDHCSASGARQPVNFGPMLMSRFRSARECVGVGDRTEHVTS